MTLSPSRTVAGPDCPVDPAGPAAEPLGSLVNRSKRESHHDLLRCVTGVTPAIAGRGGFRRRERFYDEWYAGVKRMFAASRNFFGVRRGATRSRQRLIARGPRLTIDPWTDPTR